MSDISEGGGGQSPAVVNTPAYVYDEAIMLRDVALAREALSDKHARLLFAMKSFSCVHGLKALSHHVDGFHASSLFEARLARDILGSGKTVHVTTPSLRPDEIEPLCSLASRLSFNSVPQWERFREKAVGEIECGLRINPRLSLIADERYDPCRRHSKLGAPIDEVQTIMRSAPDRLEGLSGVLIHTNADSTEFHDLLNTVRYLDDQLAPLLSRLTWINLGGGYLFYDPANFAPVREAIALLRSKYDLDVYFEPGASIIRRAGTLVCSVVDLFSADGKQIAVLDGSVNHVPEVFEYQFSPDVAGAVEKGPHEYILAGATCLAGDVFGSYAFTEPLRIGSSVIVQDIGAYSTVKASMFNGVNLPSIYTKTTGNEYLLRKEFTYEYFFERCGGVRNAGL